MYMVDDVVYSTSVRKDICIAFCYYNPGGDPVIRRNVQELEDKLTSANIPYFNAEVLFNGAKGVLVEPTLTVSIKSALFYKESVWNLLEKKIPSEFTKICFMETNLKYTRADWLDCLSLMLNFYDVIQPYNEIIYLDASGSVVNKIAGAVKSGTLDNEYGNIWGITRSFFSKAGGFLDKSVISPDLLYSALQSPVVPVDMPLIDSAYDAYAKSLNKLEYKIKFLNCPVYSLPNGYLGDSTRLSVTLNELTADWDSLFVMNSDSLWELKDDVLNASFLELYIKGGVPAVVEAPKVINVAVEIPMVIPVVVVPVVEVPKVVPVVVIPKVVPVTKFMNNMPAVTRNNADRADAAALIAKFKKN